MGFNYTSFCNRKNSFRFPVSDTRLPLNAARSQIMTECIRLCYQYKVTDLTGIVKYLRSRYETTPAFTNPQVTAANLMRDACLIRRAVVAEGKRAMNQYVVFPKGSEEAKIADMMKVTDSSLIVVKFYIGKSEYTKSGKSDELFRTLSLYRLILLGRSKASKGQRVSAQYRFLRKDSDRGGTLDPDFFGDNVLTMDDRDTLDTEMQPRMQKMQEGFEPEEIPEEECKRCRYEKICHYTDPPMPIPMVPAGSRSANIQFSDEQKVIINWKQGALNVVAGAGTGKTACVVEHVAKLLQDGVLPEKICMITYTVAGAGEMRERIRKRVTDLHLNADVELIHIGTFHAFSNEIVMDRYADVGLMRKPTVIKNMNRLDIIDKMLTENPIPGWSGRAFRQYDSQDAFFGGKGALQIAADVFSAVKQIRAIGETPTQDLVRQFAQTEDTPGSVINELIKRSADYENHLKQEGLIEFADMPAMMFEIFRKNPDYLKEHYPFEHIIVDEFQDSNEGQIQLINLLVGLPSWKSLITVGDDAQSIMSFQGSSPEFILHLTSYLNVPVTQHQLVENHRSCKAIIDVANRENDKRIEKVDKQLIPTRDGGLCHVEGFYKHRGEPESLTWKKVGEVDWTVYTIIKKIVFDGVSPEDIAVIAYTKRELEDYSDALTNAARTITYMEQHDMFKSLTPEQNARLNAIRSGVPSMFAAPEFLVDNSRVSAMVAFGRFLVDRMDTQSALIVYNTMIHGKVMDLPEAEIQDGIELVKGMASEIDEKFTLAEKKELLFTAMTMLAQGDETAESFRDAFENEEYDEILHDLLIFTRFGAKDTYKRTRKYPGVCLVTAHSSKGLEWKIVFNTVTKYQKQKMSRAAAEETRRLLFVSETRARDELYVTGVYASGSVKMGTLDYNMFLQDAFDTMDVPYMPQYA